MDSSKGPAAAAAPFLLGVTGGTGSGKVCDICYLIVTIEMGGKIAFRFYVVYFLKLAYILTEYPLLLYVLFIADFCV